jgi:hypothetical protein
MGAAALSIADRSRKAPDCDAFRRRPAPAKNGRHRDRDREAGEQDGAGGRRAGFGSRVAW